jgi:hypothetical protein
MDETPWILWLATVFVGWLEMNDRKDEMKNYSGAVPGCVTKPILVSPARRAALIVSATLS